MVLLHLHLFDYLDSAFSIAFSVVSLKQGAGHSALFELNLSYLSKYYKFISGKYYIQLFNQFTVIQSII